MQTTIYTKPKENSYSPNGWQGKLYNSSYSVKEIAHFVRHFMKKQYPKCTFSVTSDRNHINVALMSADFNPFVTPSREAIEQLPSAHRMFGTTDEKIAMWQKAIEQGHHTVNQYYIAEDYRLSEAGRQCMQFIKNVLDAYNYDDSNIQSDYFSTNFYMTIAIGKWDKPFIIKSK